MDKIFEKNKLGVPIKVCCASCAFKVINGKEKRECKISKLSVSPHDLCSEWKMIEWLNNAGLGGGSIKKKQWLDYVRDGEGTFEQKKRDFERAYGSRYIIK